MPLDLAAARQTMVETQVRVNDVTDPFVQAAMRNVAREACCGANAHLAYADAPVEYAPGLFLMRPRDVAKLLQAVRPREGQRALAIAAPYAGAVLQSIGLTVDFQQPHEPVSGDYDVIISEGAVPAAPQSWVESLAVGGRLAVVERTGAAGQAKVYLRTDDEVGSRVVFDAHPPLLPGFAAEPTFAL
jgi:protein-L-isoaspartate(D-aspartate) O-methyltransferase